MDLLFEVAAAMAVLLIGLSPPIATTKSGMVEAAWCVARSEASNQALQTALNYACAAGADCAPILPTGLCYLPNTVQAHASYVFNSYYQRKGDAPGSCDFAGSAILSKTDPSYGSCVYPSSPSAAGGMGGAGSTTAPFGLMPPPPRPPELPPHSPAAEDGHRTWKNQTQAILSRVGRITSQLLEELS